MDLDGDGVAVTVGTARCRLSAGGLATATEPAVSLTVGRTAAATTVGISFLSRSRVRCLPASCRVVVLPVHER